MTPAVVRRADVAALAALRRAWTDELAGAPIDDPDFEHTFSEWYATERSRRTNWIAEISDEPVGMLNLVEFRRMPRPGRPQSRWGYVSNVFVLAAYRDQGIGEALLDAAMSHARVHGYARVVLAPSERSVPFYRRAGFGEADMLLAHPAAGEPEPAPSQSERATSQSASAISQSAPATSQS
ncbi:MAG: GNAT family N-acetyltransferase [Micromonosporaceae bacterium]